MYIPVLAAFALLESAIVSSATAITCKTSPHDAAWPSVEEWNALNKTIEETLLRTSPAASSCYPGNPFSSSHACSSVKSHWSYAAYHAAWPESNDYSVYNNNSCLPQEWTDILRERDAVSADCRNTLLMRRPTIKLQRLWHGLLRKEFALSSSPRDMISAGGMSLDDLASTGAYSLSIWTHNFSRIQHQPAWRIPGSNESADVLICGGGNNWGTVYNYAHKIKRTVVGGEDATVGLGGLIQNGGHGLLSSTHGLASDQVYQVTVVTPDGQQLVANDHQNKDLFWAVRGTGGGQFGVVTEFVLKTHPVPVNVVTGGLTFYPRDKSNASESASWAALAEIASLIPDLMDYGITGTIMSMTGEEAVSLVGLSESLPGASVIISFISYNSTVIHMNQTIQALVAKLHNVGQDHINHTVTTPSAESYWSYTKPNFLFSQSAGACSLFTSRLLGRSELSDLPKSKLIWYLKQISVAEDSKKGGLLLFGLQGGRGPASIPDERRGSVLPAWRKAYAHVMAYGASSKATDPSSSLKESARWYETVKEPVWREWAPNTGSYMNEGNAFSSTWKHDFYGANYDRLLGIKQEYDPYESLFVYSGIGSDKWHYDLDTGLVCHSEE
ncbi:hypothetical protein N7462_002595 [Penicillium macrosclerotiorum]|uniref:uncharacterized protein n=1 Tax=Penicillium macrosclerotiorum TaxID=303699 RepID=UPI0025490429|nr:uncharacterized protein N7462_002595 [Penicillium macrosclerotiorum]KAJ5693172.1 hypothetical protein N7462_002595 [Penicillium macrosclerotiorum]